MNALLTFLSLVLEVVDFLLAALTLVVALVPVAAFFAAPRFEAVVVFLGVVDALGLPASVFLGPAAFFSLALETAVFLVAAAFLVVDVFFTVVADFLAGAALVVDVAGLEFYRGGSLVRAIICGRDGLTSLEALAFLGASLTLPEGPLGRTKMPFSAPD